VFVVDTNRKGAIAEAAIALAGIRLGIPVLKPIAEHGRYDLGFELGDRILRVQCKWGALDEAGAVIIANLTTYSLTFSGHRRTRYTEHEIDLLAVYCGALDRCYLLPSALVAGRSQISLRLSPTLNGQRACVTLASDYEFAGAIAQLGEHLRGTQGVAGSSPASSTPSAVDVGCHQFRNHFGYYLERAAAGEEIRISRRGRPYARLVPAEPAQPELAAA
jgi:prevent-host-death family protein